MFVNTLMRTTTSTAIIAPFAGSRSLKRLRSVPQNSKPSDNGNGKPPGNPKPISPWENSTVR
jgi:hypothetical protein